MQAWQQLYTPWAVSACRPPRPSSRSCSSSSPWRYSASRATSPAASPWRWPSRWPSSPSTCPPTWPSPPPATASSTVSGRSPDHRRGGLPLQTDGEERPVRGDPQLGAVDYRRPAPAGTADRLLLRGLPRRRRRFRRAGGDHRRPARRPRLQSALRRRPVPDRQHCAGGLRRTGHPDHRRRPGDRHRRLQDRRHDRPPTAVPVDPGTVLAGVHDGRLARHPRNPAGRHRRRRQLRHHSVPDVQLHRPGVAGHHLGAGQPGLPDPVPQGLAAAGRQRSARRQRRRPWPWPVAATAGNAASNRPPTASARSSRPGRRSWCSPYW